jgi:hypothetical protein
MDFVALRLSQQALFQAEVQHRLRCLKRRAVCKTATAIEIGEWLYAGSNPARNG